MNWPFILRCTMFGVLTGLYSVAVTYSTVGFAIATLPDILKVVALYLVSSIGGIFAYVQDAEKAWNSGPGGVK